MKKGICILTFLFLLATKALLAQVIHTGNGQFVHPLVERWMAEYNRRHDAGATPSADGKPFELTIVTGQAQGDAGQATVVYVGSYALVPVVNTQHPLLAKASKGLSKKELIQLVFEKDAWDEDFDPDEKSKYTATVYSRGGKSFSSAALADYFAQRPERIKGKKIIGDEIYLLQAVQKDVNGLTFNPLNYIFDLDAHQVKDNISLLPLHLKSKQREVFQAQDLEQIIALLEETPIETIPVQAFGFSIPAAYAHEAEVLRFVQWVLTEGQQYNHAYGFLHLGKAAIAQQKQLLEHAAYLSYSQEKQH